MAKILIIRFSALGDVAMAIPVLFSMAKKHPEREFIFLTDLFFDPLRPYFPHNVQLQTVAIHRQNVWGLYQLYRQLKPLQIEAVSDLDDVIRTKVL